MFDIKKLKVLSNISRFEDYIRIGLNFNNTFITNCLLFPYIFIIGGGEIDTFKNTAFDS